MNETNELGLPDGSDRSFQKFLLKGDVILMKDW